MKDKSAPKDETKDSPKTGERDRGGGHIETRMATDGGPRGPSSSDTGKHSSREGQHDNSSSGSKDQTTTSETRTQHGGTEKTTTTEKPDGTVTSRTDHYDSKNEFTGSTHVKQKFDLPNGKITTDTVNKGADGKVTSTEHTESQRTKDGWTEKTTQTDYAKDGRVTGSETTDKTQHNNGKSTETTVRMDGERRVKGSDERTVTPTKDGHEVTNVSKNARDEVVRSESMRERHKPDGTVTRDSKHNVNHDRRIWSTHTVERTGKDGHRHIDGWRDSTSHGRTTRQPIHEVE
ncbi:hypothetical protein [Streptomyces xanthophaeus]